MKSRAIPGRDFRGILLGTSLGGLLWNPLGDFAKKSHEKFLENAKENRWRYALRNF